MASAPEPGCECSLHAGRVGSALLVITLGVMQGCSEGPELQPWHTEALTQGLTAAMAGDSVRTFDDYQSLEQRLLPAE